MALDIEVKRAHMFYTLLKIGSRVDSSENGTVSYKRPPIQILSALDDTK